MRIVAVADTHTFQADLRDLPAGDVFIHAGDLLRGGSLGELASVIPWLDNLPYRHKIVVAGNHDRCCEREPEAARAMLEGTGAIYLQDEDIVIDGVRFWGSPWQPEFNEWAFNLPRGAPLAEKWALIPDGIDVLITHGPPLGIGDRSGHDARGGCADLREAVRRIRPLLHLFGHIHQDGGCWREDDTCFANVTTWESIRPPSVFDLNIQDREVMEQNVPPPRKSKR